MISGSLPPRRYLANVNEKTKIRSEIQINIPAVSEAVLWEVGMEVGKGGEEGFSFFSLAFDGREQGFTT